MIDMIEQGMVGHITQHDFATAQDSADALAEDVATVLHAAIQERGTAKLAISGGKSPIPFFHALREKDVEWSRVIITLVDDRQVPEDSPLSNAALVRREMLADRAASAQFVPLTGPHTEQHIHPPFDSVVLGMGTDGHTASLFPGQAMDGVKGEQILAITPDPLPVEAPVARWSWSFSALSSAHHLALLISGAEKRAVLERALTQSNPQALPISAFLHTPSLPITIYWSS